MNIAFAGFRHGHIFGLYNIAKDSSEVEIVGCFEEDEATRIETEQRDVVFNYDKYEDILNDEKVDIVAIGDYYGKRGSMVIAALESGKHVICDKPICTDLNELESVVKTAINANYEDIQKYASSPLRPHELPHRILNKYYPEPDDFHNFLSIWILSFRSLEETLPS